MKTLLECTFLICAVILLSGCAPPQPIPVQPIDAQNTVFQMVTSSQAPETGASYLMLGSRPGFLGHVIAYWMCRPAAPNSPAAIISGYEIVQKFRGQEGKSSLGIEFEEALPAANSLIEFIADAQIRGSEKRNVLFGRILSPEVRALEVVYADDQRLHWQVVGNGFLLFRQEPVDWTELLILGENNQELKTYDLTLENPTRSERDEHGEQNCPEDTSRIPAPATTIPSMTDTTVTRQIPSETPLPSSTVRPTATITPDPTKTPAPPSQTPTTALTQSADNNISFAAGMSTEGRFVAFTSYNDRLVPDDTNGMPDAFVFDRETRTIERVSVTSNGEELPGWTFASSISADGRFVLFTSDSRTMPLFDSNLPGGLFLHDRHTGQTELLGKELGYGMTDYTIMNGKISADGRFVIMEVVNIHWSVFLLDRQTNVVKRLSEAPDGDPANGDSTTTAMTPDGRWIAFLSQASNLAPDDDPCSMGERWQCADLFVYDRVNAKLERIPVGFGMCLGCPADRLAISADGRWIAYNDMDDQNRFLVRVYDRQTQQTKTVCADNEGNCSGHTPAISADGRWLAFAAQQVFVQEQQTGQIQQVSITQDGQPADDVSGMINLQGEGFSSDVQISGDGQWIAFSSVASNLLPEGVEKQSCTLFLDRPYPCFDLFMKHRESGEIIWINTQQP